MCNTRRVWPSLALFCVLTWSARAAFQQQYFRVVPRNTRVHEGGEAVLECEISNLAGMVQWAKDGFALGFASIIPGYPRYTMVGDRRHGVYNLRIANATLEDDAEFQCQVGPAQMHKVIRANSSLTVIAPPTAVDILGHPTGSKLEIKEGADVTLECHVKNAKPAAKIVWYRGNTELKLDRREDEIIDIDGPTGNRKSTRYTTKSKIHLKPSSEDDYSEFICEARHEALQRDLPMRSSVQLSVLYPPGAPYIEGYAEGETVRRGQTLELVCRSRGGNPPAQLIWYKNGEQIRMAYRTAGRVSENVLTFTADASDNKARYRCEAKNVMISNTLKAEVDLTVLFAPSQVAISGPGEARVGDPVPLTCSTAPSNPPAEIKWVVIGKHYKDATTRTVMSPEGGWISTSNITVVVEPNRRSIVAVCHGLNVQLTENVVSTHTINVLYPPSAPMISGYTPGTTLAAGTVQKLLCISSGGNPLASLTWYKNDKKIHSVTKGTDKSVSAEISILTNVTDNQAQYRCEAANSATEIPLFETVTLSVHFAPEAVKVRVEPPDLRPGEVATLVCDAASSNPPAALSWWRDGIPVQGLPSTSKPGLHGGTVSTIELKLNVTKEMNGAVYTCQAMNEALQRSVHDAQALKVLYAPIFDAVPRETSGDENESLVIVLRADGNPSSISYTWTKDGLPITQSSYSTGNDRIISEGSMLNITKLSRHDAGIYTCEALNSQGAATINITVAVNYPASIKAVSKNIMVDPNEDAILWCIVVGNPLTEEHVAWKREGYNKFDSKTTVTFDERNQTSYLHVGKADRADVGNFKCVVDNGIGKPASEDVMLVVKFQPEMRTEPNTLKFASNTGVEGKMSCACNAAPAPVFTWSKSGVTLPANVSTKYYTEYSKLDGITYTSVLHISRVASTDYGSYECAAKNEMGSAKIALKLDVTSAPDQVTSLHVKNVTHNSATLEWVPGFDGGMQPSYRIRYRKLYDESYKYEDVMPLNATAYTIDGLERATDYVFSIMAVNKLGQSKYRPDDVKATTHNEIPSSVQSSSEEYNSYSYPGIFIITGTIVGTALILLNVLVIGFCLHRRTNKRIRALTELGELSVTPTRVQEKQPDSSQSVIVYVSVSAAILILTNIALIGCFLWRRRVRRLKEQAGQSSKSATIEMYAPSSYNDTMTGETLSSVSEKSETYSNEEGENDHHGIRPPPIPEVPVMPNRHNIGQTETYLMEDQMVIPPPVLDYPPPNYVAYDSEHHARTLPHPHRHKEQSMTHTLNRNTGKQPYVPAPSPMPPLDGSYYNMSSDRYLSYPPLINEYLHHNQIGRTPTPPQQYATQPPQQKMNPNASLLMIGLPPSAGSPAHAVGGSPPPNYMHDGTIPMDRQSAGGTLRRQRLDKMAAVPPPDVTVLHANCNQKHNRSPQTQGSIEKQPQSILKDTSRHKYQTPYSQHGSPLSASTPLANNSSQILTVQNLTSEVNNVPQYGTIRKENKKNNVTIDESFNKRNETHVV